MIKRLLALASVLTAVGCIEVPGPGIGACPVDVDAEGKMALASFTPVSLVIEQRCGSLDCHGNLARPMRIFGSRGLRYVPLYTIDKDGKVIASPDATAYVDPTKAATDGTYAGPGGNATTEAEREENVRSICGLQPELMNQVVLQGANPEQLLVLSKPLHLERHKGEKVFERGSLDYVCIRSWLTSKLPDGSIDAAACQETLENP